MTAKCCERRANGARIQRQSPVNLLDVMDGYSRPSKRENNAVCLKWLCKYTILQCLDAMLSMYTSYTVGNTHFANDQ